VFIVQQGFDQRSGQMIIHAIAATAAANAAIPTQRDSSSTPRSALSAKTAGLISNGTSPHLFAALLMDEGCATAIVVKSSATFGPPVLNGGLIPFYG